MGYLASDIWLPPMANNKKGKRKKKKEKQQREEGQGTIDLLILEHASENDLKTKFQFFISLTTILD